MPPAAERQTLAGLEPGDRIQHFEIINEIGQGGMGRVFLARDLKLGRRVAIKVLTTRSEALTRRLLTEARATVRCSHENIVVLYEVGEHAGCPYLVLEYLEGQVLSALLRDGPVPQRRALQLIIPVIKALRRAHEFQIVHRDLKPANVFVTNTGTVKVLDFGIARAFSGEAEERSSRRTHVGDILVTREDEITGTAAYMAPEQWGMDTIDPRTDLWAVGIILWRMLIGRHPLEGVAANAIMAEVVDLDTPMPSLAEASPHLHPELARAVDRCLAKPKDDRFGSATELLELLEGLLHHGRSLRTGECPYPGLRAYQESDAGRFFGRTHDVTEVATMVRSTPLVAVTGPSGVGKSSLIRAGVVPALRAGDESLEVLTLRPGRTPLSGLAVLLESLSLQPTQDRVPGGGKSESLAEQLRAEPGLLGRALRKWAAGRRARVLLFVDQFEELYTLVEDQATRDAFVDSLAGAADDPSSPIRIALSIRSDLLDRAAENRRFFQVMKRGLYFLPPPDRDGLKEALVAPLRESGYEFESAAIVDRMLAELDSADGALPLLQFAAGKLWERRDQHRKLLTAHAYEEIGGVGGALALHADQVVAQLPQTLRRLIRSAMLRLVTPEGTREITDLEDLEALSANQEDMRSLIGVLADERLVVVRSDGTSAGPVVELVHESLVRSWPALRRWREENSEDSFFLEQLRTAAKQWHSRNRPKGLLWRGEAAADARRFEGRFTGDLAAREREYLDAVLSLDTQSARRRRRIVLGVMLLLLSAVVAAGIGLLAISEAEREAIEQSENAKLEAERANEALRKMRIKEEQRLRAEAAASEAREQVAAGEEALAMTNEQLKDALQVSEDQALRAEEEARRANRAALEARKARQSAETLLRKERERLEAQRARNKELQRKLEKLGTNLRR